MSRFLPSLYVVAVAFIAGFASSCSAQTPAPPEVVEALSQATETVSPVRPDEVKPGEWPRWSGPRGDGISRETNWTSNWPADGPPRLWSRNLGVGYSSFAVSGDRVFTMGHIDGEEVVYCLNAATGETVWEHRYKCALVNNLHKGGPGATPTLEGEFVYTLSREGQLFCLRRNSGEVVWDVRIPELTGVKFPDWGYTSSPLIVGEKVILDAGHVVALNKTTGELIWKSENKYRPGYGSPAWGKLGGEEIIAVLNNDCLLITRLADGTEVARYPWTSDYATTAGTPILVEDTIFISSGYNRGCALFHLQDGKLEPYYDNRNMRNHMNNSIFWEGKLYGFDGNSHNRRNVTLNCIDYATGEKLWEEKGLGCGSLLIADGKLVCLSDDGFLVVAEASPAGYRELARAKVLDETCWTVPVLAGGKIFCRNDEGDTVCVDVGK